VFFNLANAGHSDQKEVDRATARMDQLSTRSLQANQSGDTLAARLLFDSVAVVTDQMFVAQYPALKQCGATPVKPAKPTAPRFEVTNEGQQTFTRRDLGYLRERLGVYVALKEQGNTNAITRAYQPTEIAALDARQRQLDLLVSGLSATNTSWKTWQDLPSW
jgi:hypothetical protein